MQEPSEWSVDWLKNTRDAAKLIESVKYIVDPTGLLVIGSVCKKDEEKNRTFHKETPYRNICNFCVQKFGDCIHLKIHEELPCIDIWKVTTERKRIINYCRVLECSPKLNQIKWMKNEETLVLRNRKYVGGGLNDGFITIKSPTKADRGTYSCTVTNAVGSVSKNITLEPPIVSTSHKSYNGTRSVKLIGNVSVIDGYPALHSVNWFKNGEMIDIQAGGRIHLKRSDKNPSLTIHNVNHQDAGSYRLTVTNAVGSDNSDIVFDVPVIRIERHEDLDGSECFTAKIKSTPAAYHAQWKVKKNDDDDEFSFIDVDVAEYKGTSNSLPCPLLVVTKTELLENQRFHIKVDNFIGSTIKEIFDTPIRHFYYKPAEHFPHFSYIYNLIRDCKSRIEKRQCSKDQGNLMPKDIVVRIGVAGNFHEDNLNLISKSSWREKLPEDQHIWDVSPLIYFQNDLSLHSVIKIAHQTSARHRIIIKSDTVCDETNETDDSNIIVSENKQTILETIITCLEEPFHKILQKWLKDLTTEESLSESAYDIIVEIEAIRKHLVFDVHENAEAVSVSKRSDPNSIIPDNVKKYLFELSDVNSFGIWRNSSLKIFVKKNTDEKKMKEELMRINKGFLKKFQLEIEERKLVQKQTLLQGDQVMDKKYGRKATLGGFVREIKNKRKIYALTCSHMFDQEGQIAYAGDFEAIGACVFTTRENACDFAAIEIKESFSDKCDLAFRRDDGKKVNAKLYTETLENIGFVFKKGATTDMTIGYIISSEYYDKVPNDFNLGTNFLVKGIDGSFVEDGDSGSLVFSRPNCAQQTSVDVVGMVYATNLTVKDEVDHGKPHCKSSDNRFDNISVCYRIHTALELFEKKLGINVQFKDDLSLISTSSLHSYSSADSLDIL